MKAARVLLVAGTLIVLPLPSVAQEIYGRVWVSQTRNAAVSAKVTVTCDKKKYSDTALTDRNGVYRVKGPGKEAKCTAQVRYQNRNSTRVTFYSSRSRTRANLELRKRNGKWSLYRR